jgi:hypothetical protein
MAGSDRVVAVLMLVGVCVEKERKPSFGQFENAEHFRSGSYQTGVCVTLCVIFLERGAHAAWMH